MAGWTDSGSSRGRGGGGFANRGGANSNMNTRWRERRPAQLQQQHQQQHQQHQQQHQQHQQHQYQQQHQQHRYRPVNNNDRSSQHPHHPPAEEPNRHRGQGGFSTSTRRPQPTRPPQAHPTFTDNKSPAPTANVNANANDNESDDKARRNAANFECNVCFDMADDPVVTKCGHLFCWECLYQWLHVHSQHRECPVCKGQVADDAIIPIYGRGGSAASVHVAPPRPTGARVESSRQQQQQQQAAVDWHMVDDDEDDNPFDDLHRLFGGTMLANAMMSLMPEEHMVTEVYGDYSNPYHHNDFDEIHDFDILGSPVLASAGASSSWRHGHHTAFSDDMTIDSFFDNTTYPEPGYAYRGGRRQRGRARGAASADHSSMADMSSWAMGGSSSATYRETGAGGPHMNNTGGSSRPNGGWTERRGRSHRNSNSGGGGGRGSQNNSRRQGANYN
uniref:Uncharacterized protein n=1 Tax=Avena sativa TaxID=4498 RepID=A0ACD5TM93_AVESA